jgi:hypothetical protein
VAQGEKQFDERLREKTKQVMAHEPTPLPDEVLVEMEKMAEHWE